MPVQPRLVAVGQADGEADVHAAVCGDLVGHGVDVHDALVALDRRKIELRIGRGDGAVGIEVVLLHGLGVERVMRTVCGLQQDERILLVDLVVAVKVIDIDALAVGGERHVRIQRIGAVAHVILALDLLDGHGRDLAAECIVQRRIGQVLDGEAAGVDAGALRIVAEGQLDLTVVAFLLSDEQIGRRCHGLLQLHQAGALLARGIGHAGVRVGQRLGRAHHERHGQRADREALLLAELVFLDVLRHDRCAARCGRSRHGRAAHHAVAAVVQRGIDVSAGRHKLGLQVEIFRRTPGGERAGLVAVGHAVQRLGLGGDGHLAAPEAGRLILRRSREDLLRLALLDHNGRVREVIARQGHVDGAGRVVVDDGRRGTCLNGRVGLVRKRRIAAGDQDDLALHVDVCIVLGQAVDALALDGIAEEDIIIRRAALVLARVERGEILCAVGLTGVAGDRGNAVELAHHTAHARVRHGGDREGVRIGAGAAAGVHAHIRRIGHAGSGQNVLAPSAVIACGDRHDRIRIPEAADHSSSRSCGLRCRSRGTG